MARGQEELPPDIPVEPLETALAGAALAVTLGGDGTILQTSGILAAHGVPVLGVNLGHKGFLTELEPGELHRLADAAEGKFTVQRRMMLDVELIREGRVVYAARALNEAVVRSLVSVVRVEASGDGTEITEFSGDGIIVSTPTGSTGLLHGGWGAAGGAGCPLHHSNPHLHFPAGGRSFVLTADRRVSIRTQDQRDKKVMLSVDGEPVEFLDGDELRVNRSAATLPMARVSDRSFYDIVFEKLNDRSEAGKD